MGKFKTPDVSAVLDVFARRSLEARNQKTQEPRTLRGSGAQEGLLGVRDV